MDAVQLLRDQLQFAHYWMNETMKGVGRSEAHWAPPGNANPVGSGFAHAAMSEDWFVNEVIRGATPLYATPEWQMEVGIDKAPPGASDSWAEWGRTVNVDLAKAEKYAGAVAAKSDEYLASLKPDDLGRDVDLSIIHFGTQPLASVLSNFVIGHLNIHSGEIAALKGCQGLQGSPA